MSKCPDCKSLLRGATRCACGWREPASHAFIVASESAAAERRREEERARQERWEAAGCPSAAESIARIKRINETPKPSAKAHWISVMYADNVPSISKQYAKEALARMGVEIDDEQREAA